jgi:hypothetical protein
VLFRLRSPSIEHARGQNIPQISLFPLSVDGTAEERRRKQEYSTGVSGIDVARRHAQDGRATRLGLSRRRMKVGGYNLPSVLAAE